LGSTIINWFNRKKNFVVLSSTEAEYMTTSMDRCEAIWIQKFIICLFDKELEPTMI
jgi:hypothetical protein